MRALLLSSFMLALTACGGGSSNSSTPTNPDPGTTINQPPTVMIEGDLAFTAETRFTLRTTLTDKENDSLKVEWTSNYQGVEFLNTTTNATEVKLPSVTEPTTITLTVTVTDSANNKTAKSHVITVSPKPKTPENPDNNVALFDMQSEYSVKTNEDIQIPVSFESPYVISSVDWEFTGFTPQGLVTNSEFDDKTGKSIIKFQAPNVSQSTSFELTLTLTTSNAIYHAKTKLNVTVDDLPAFTVSFTSPLELVEGQEGELKTEVVRSEDITFFEWNWMPKPDPDIIRINSSGMKFKAPEVDKDTVFDVSLTLTGASGREATATTTVTVKKASDLLAAITSNRNFVTTGHRLILDVHVLNFDDIVNFSWSNADIDNNAFTQTKSKLEVYVPAFTERNKSLEFHYEATLKSGSRVSGSTIVFYVTPEELAEKLDLTSSSKMEILPNEKVSHVFTLKDTSNMVESISIISNQSENEYSLLENDFSIGKKDITVTALITNPAVASDVPLTALLKSGSVETRKVLNAKLETFKFVAYPGLETRYHRGSDFYLFGLALIDDKAQPFNGKWLSVNNEYSMQNATTSVTKANLVASNPLLPMFYLSVKDANNNDILESVKAPIEYELFEKTDKMYCTWAEKQLKCNDVNFNQYITQKSYDIVRHVESKGTYACVVSNEDTVECIGAHNNVNQGVETLQNVAKINAVDESTVCAQHTDASWSCVGDNANRYHTIIDNAQTVFGIEGFGDKTCYVDNGYLKCSNNGQAPYFSTRPEYVKSFNIDEAKNKVCYKTMNDTVEQCHSL